jgi:iron(III) transport system substrate-binding protein
MAAIAAGVVVITLGACGDDSGDEGDEGGALTVYSGREEEYVGPLYEQFTEETGLEVEVKYGESSELAATLAEEGENSPADLFFSQDAGSLGAVEREGLFTALPDEVLDVVDQRYRSAEGEWVGTSGRARVVGYNTEAVSEDELPESILDFTAPEWKGRLGWAPTNGSFQAFVTAMRLTEGEDVTREWVEGIVANDPEEFADNEAIRDAIAAGEIDVGFLNHYYIAEAQAEEGKDYPVAAHYTSGDVGSLVNVAGVGVLASSDQSAEAAEFAEFMLSEPAQTHFADRVKEYPLIDSVEVDPLVTPLTEIEQPDVDLAELADLEGTLSLLQEAGAL